MISLKTVRKKSVAKEPARAIYDVASSEIGDKLMVTRGTGRRVDEALGILVSRVAAGEYGDRHVVLVEEDRELLENVEASLRQRALAMIRVDEVGESPGIVGEVPEHLVETLQAIYDAGSITNADLAAKLGLNHTACNNRATRLFKLGLIHRRKNSAAPGGRQYSYEGIA